MDRVTDILITLAHKPREIETRREAKRQKETLTHRHR